MFVRNFWTLAVIPRKVFPNVSLLHIQVHGLISITLLQSILKVLLTKKTQDLYNQMPPKKSKKGPMKRITDAKSVSPHWIDAEQSASLPEMQGAAQTPNADSQNPRAQRGDSGGIRI
jgi:hypothetical protein